MRDGVFSLSMLNAGEEGMANSVDWAALCWSGLFAADSVDSWANKAVALRSSEKRMVFFMMFNVFLFACLFADPTTSTLAMLIII